MLTWASAIATALVSAVAGSALVTALKLEVAPLPRPLRDFAQIEFSELRPNGALGSRQGWGMRVG